MNDPIVKAWLTHFRLQNMLVEAIPTEALLDTAAKGRNVGSILVHIHNNRLSWLEPAAPDQVEGIGEAIKPLTPRS